MYTYYTHTEVLAALEELPAARYPGGATCLTKTTTDTTTTTTTTTTTNYD